MFVSLRLHVNLPSQVTFPKSPRLTPAFDCTPEDLDGDAMASESYDLQFTYGYFGESFFTGNVLFGQANYDAKYPIYSRTQ